MNPLRQAIENALAVSSDRKGFLSAFDAELEKLQFRPEADAIILPVPRVAGLAWSRGEIDDFDLIVRAGNPELIFALTLPNIRTFRHALRQAKRIYQQGAKGFIANTSNPLVLRHFQRYGCAIRYHGSDGGKRFYGDELAVARFFHSPFPFNQIRPDSLKVNLANPVTQNQP